MIRRIAVAIVAIPVAVAGIRLGGWTLAVMVGGLGAIGASELYRMARQSGAWPLSGLGVASAFVLPLVAYWAIIGGRGGLELFLFGGPVWIMLTTLVAMGRGPMAKPLSSVSITLLGVAYPSGLLVFILVLRHTLQAEGAWAATWLVLVPLVIIWVGDSIAMAAGSVIGGPKLWPVLSPKKTWSGSVAGTLSALAIAPALGLLVLEEVGVTLAVWQLLLLGLGVSVAGQLGDLAESLIKREAKVKDSGSFFSGHGGVLDRLDAVYWGVPVAAALYSVFGL